MRRLGIMLRVAGWRFWAIALLAAVAYAIVVAIPTGIIPNPFFTRMLPAGPWNYAYWLLSAPLFGLVVAASVSSAFRACSVERQTTAGGLLAVLAVGCPICNKVVVLLLGVSGAPTYFQPIQPLLGALSLLLLGYALWLRLRGPVLGTAHPAL
ncbi:MAG: hypothetical protein ACR2JY_13445 [Chloroflexota bacterium]